MHAGNPRFARGYSLLVDPTREQTRHERALDRYEGERVLAGLVAIARFRALLEHAKREMRAIENDFPDCAVPGHDWHTIYEQFETDFAPLPDDEIAVNIRASIEDDDVDEAADEADRRNQLAREEA